MKSKKKLENPNFKNVKRINTNIGVSSEDESIIRKFIILVIVIVVLIGIIYAITELTKKKEEKAKEVTTGSINYNVVSIGTMFNRPEKEYYVMIYDSEDENSILYSAMITKYKNNEDNKTKLYYCDLGNNLNSKYYDINKDGKSNKDAKTIKELNLSKLTLVKIKEGKITNYIENFDDIKEILDK